MKIARVTFLGLRGLADATYDLRSTTNGEPHALVVVTGPAASGKTRFLEAIVAGKEIAAPYGGMVSGQGWVRGENESAKIVLEWSLDAEEAAFAGVDAKTIVSEALFLEDTTRSEIDEGLQTLLERYEHNHLKGKLEYFPVNRQIPRYGSGNGLEAIEQRLYRATNDERKYSFVPRFVQSLRRDSGRREYFTTLLGYLSPSVRCLAESEVTDELAVFASLDGLPTEAHLLSSSEADAVVFAATATLAALSHSLVLVDRPDLHQSPEVAARFVEALCSLGRDNQVFVATSSQEILASVDPSQIIRLAR